MNGRFHFNFIKKRKLHHVLRRHLQQTDTGQQILDTYAQDRQQGLNQLTTYLQTTLTHNETLAKQIAEALDHPYNKQFTTIITGGQIGQIINAQNVENLHQPIYIFSSTAQVVAFLLILIVTTSSGGYAIWQSRQPDKMMGKFNIAVAKFVSTGLDATTNAEATAVRRHLVSFLDGQYQFPTFGVEVATQNMPTITNAEEAKTLAQKINADIVIYGDILTAGNQVLLIPQFYIDETYQTGTGEVNGEHRLTAPIDFERTQIINPSSQELTLMKQRATIMIEFTKALVYLGNDDLPLADQAINQALTAAQKHAPFTGQEVLYLFASHIALLQSDDISKAQQYVDQALSLNNKYGRALIAQGNIYYQQRKLDEARTIYQKAKDLDSQSTNFEALITEKANLSLGNVYTTQYQELKRTANVNETDTINYANEAIRHYQLVIDAHLQQPDNRLLADLATSAYYGSGIVYQTAENCTAARQALTQTEDRLGQPSLNIGRQTDLIEDVNRRLQELQSCDET